MADKVIQITDGTTTINLDGSGSYKALSMWRPAVATRRRGVMGNQLPWNDVVEEIPITISGADVDTLISNETSLVNLIDQAQRWQDGENVAAVLFKYRHQDSTITNAYSSTILGTVEPTIEYMGETFSFSSNGLYRQVILRFVRLGVWLGDEETASANTTNPGDIGEVTFSNDYDIGIIKATFDTTYAATNGGSWEGIIAITDKGADDHIEILNFSSGSGSGFSTTTANGLFERSGAANISVSNAASGAMAFTLSNSAIQAATLFDVYITASVDAASPASEFELFATVGSEATIGSFLSGKTINIPEGTRDESKPLVYFLGTFPITGDTWQYLQIDYTRTSGSDNLAIDYVAIIKRDSSFCNVVQVNPTTDYQFDDYVIDHRLLTDITPGFTVTNVSTSGVYVPHGGSLFFLSTGTIAQVLVMVTGGQGDDNWRYSGNTSTLDTFDVDLTRRPIYLVPQ